MGIYEGVYRKCSWITLEASGRWRNADLLLAGKENTMILGARGGGWPVVKDIDLPLCYGVGRPHVKCFAHFWASQLKEDMEVLERVQWKVTKMVRGLKKGWESWTCLAWRRCLHLSVFTSTLRTPKGVRGWGQILSSGGMSVWLSEGWYVPYRAPDVGKG